MDDDNSISEDEWTSIKKRFKSEGLEWDSDSDPHQKVLQLFRWLVDAEANLKASRNINEKLRNQQEEEKRIAYLLVERQQLTEDLKQAEGNPTTETKPEDEDQLRKVKAERNILKQKNEEVKHELNKMEEKLYFLERSSKQLEEHNENLSFKLSEALLEIEDRERQLFNTDGRRDKSRMGIRKDSISEPCSILYHRANKSPPDKEMRNPGTERRRSSAILNFEPSSLDSIVGGESPQRLNNFFDSQISNSKSHLSHLNDVKKLQNEVQRLRSNYLKAGNKAEEIQRKFETLQLTSSSEREMLIKEQDVKINKLEKLVKELSNKVELSKDSTQVEAKLRAKIEKDLQHVLSERKADIARVRENERKQSQAEEEMKVLQEKLTCSEEEVERLNRSIKELTLAQIKG